ncbi:CBU_0592 family membrane protein [Streptosporangium sp. CA-135522]|uniref:CBU_0592 family membrane protein n=1 Tax=Streptosporangium sp. CA-135522 TaxID=3240072 RepID=UPI003D89D161
MSLLINTLGWLGAGLMLYGYATVSASRMAGDGMPYQTINLVGAIALMINSAYHSAWPSAILNVVWGVIGLMAAARMFMARTRKKTVRVP